MIYLDHAATTPVRREVLEAMLPGFTEHWGNPSSIYAAGRRARQALDEARETIAGAIGAEPREIVFTSGGTEADNLAVKGIAWAASARGRHIVTSPVEHHAVLHACQVLQRSGFDVTTVGVDRWGRVDPDEVAAAIGEHTVLVTIIAASNEVGTIQPVAEIGAICRERRVPFHTDAVQAAGSVPIDVDALGVSLLSLAAHKIHGPKGIGALYVRRGTQLLAQHHGGSQERQRRAGTESVALAAGFAAALAMAVEEREAETARQAVLRDRLITRIGSIDDVEPTGHPNERLANNASFVIGGIQGGDLVAALDMAGIAASTGSACTSGSVEPSHVLLAMGVAPERAQGSLRLTLGRETTVDEIDRTIEVVRETVGRLRGARAPLPEVASVS